LLGLHVEVRGGGDATPRTVFASVGRKVLVGASKVRERPSPIGILVAMGFFRFCTGETQKEQTEEGKGVRRGSDVFASVGRKVLVGASKVRERPSPIGILVAMGFFSFCTGETQRRNKQKGAALGRGDLGCNGVLHILPAVNPKQSMTRRDPRMKKEKPLVFFFLIFSFTSLRTSLFSSSHDCIPFI